ncbi:hypothetical protein CR513_24088, partial [Mucuna pruriens]
MALSKLLVASLVVSFVLFPLLDADQPGHAQTQDSLVQKIDCNAACAARCRLASRQLAATACHRALPVTKKCVPAMPASPPTVADASALRKFQIIPFKLLYVYIAEYISLVCNLVMGSEATNLEALPW